MRQSLLHRIIEEKDVVVPTLFKPVQFRVIEKVEKGASLTKNEKRYLRGNIQQKLSALQELTQQETDSDSLRLLLDSIGSYYITGLEALKHNGFGWYFQSKIIEVINTKIKGMLRVQNKTIKFIRIKSIAASKNKRDRTGLSYATNEQIIKDVRYTKNSYTESVWKQMLARYGKMFVKSPAKYNMPPTESKNIDYASYGV